MPLTKQMANHFTRVLKLSEEASRTWEGGRGGQSTRWATTTTRSFTRSPGPGSRSPEWCLSPCTLQCRLTLGSHGR